MPIFVEILDLSHNDITAIDNKCFSVSIRQHFIETIVCELIKLILPTFPNVSGTRAYCSAAN